MAVKIRLKRMGAKKRPFYRLVVADSRAARDGAFIESIGYYNPIAEPAEIEIDEEKALDWLRKGAQPSETAKSPLKRTGILEKFAASRKEGLEAIVKNLVELFGTFLASYSVEVVVDVREKGREVVYTRYAAPDDRGRLIGKGGRIANAIRTVVKASANKSGVQVHVEIEERQA